MILFQNGFVKLDYDPTTDILYVDMPTVDNLVLPEVRQALRIIVEHVRNYDVKRLLIDARKTEVEVSEETYATMLADFRQNLMATRLKKLARIVSGSTIRENAVKKVYEKQKLTIEIRSFTEVAPAVEWLVS
ncbi:hypothetical protein GCM10027443_07030 [Pontibacter brevis]